MGARGKSRSAENYEAFGNEWKTGTSRVRGCMEGFTHGICRPLRIFQFLTTLLLFSMIVYLSAMEARRLTDLASILLIILTSAYLFFMAIDMISQFEAHELPDTPMFLFSILGMLFFAIAGVLLIQYSVEEPFWALVLAKILCFIISLLFLMEVIMLLTSWRQRCITWTRCYPYTPARGCGRLILFPGDDKCAASVEVGCANATTSVSDNEAPMEDINSAVTKHGCRRISVGRRRQYVDRDSSACGLSTMQIAEIQTDRQRTTITECQTQRTETKETVIQTISRCELCNRQMDDRSVSPEKSCVRSASIASNSPYPPSPRLTALPRIVQCNQASGTDTICTNLPTSTTLDPLVQQSSCIVCPALLQMMREGMPTPCCKSCNCERGKNRPRRAQGHASEPRNSGVQLCRWSQSEPERTSKSSNAAKPAQSESPSTNNDKSDAERIDLKIEEGNRHWPTKRISRVYETRTCPTHGPGLAARASGLPETVTKVTLSSVYVRRNKRTQTPNKDSVASEDNGRIAVNEDTPKEGKNSDNKDTRENGQEKSHEENRTRPKSEETNERLSEDRIKLRLAGCVTPRKLYRNSEPMSQLKKPATTSTDCCSVNKCRVASRKEETIPSPRAMSRKTDGTEKVRSIEIPKIGHRSIVNKELPIEEATLDSRRGTSKSWTPINEENEIEEPRTTKHSSSLKEETNEDAEVEGSRTSSAGDASTIGTKKSTSVSGPVLRLRLETAVDPSTSADAASESEATWRAGVSGSRSSLRSRSRGLPSVTGSQILSENRQADTWHETTSRVRQEAIGVWRSIEISESSTSRDKSVKGREEPPKNLRCVKTGAGCSRASTTPPNDDKIGYKYSWSEEETDAPKDHARRTRRTKSIIRKDGTS